VDCFHTGQPVSVADLSSAGRWPRFTAAAAEVGFAAVHALPMRLRTEVIGALNFFDTNPGALGAGKLRIGQALADVATIGLLQQRAIHRRDMLTEQLQTALNSRVLIEQAKGVLAERLHVDVADAFTLLRNGARSHNRRLSDLAQAIIDGTEQIPATATSRQPPDAPRPGRHRSGADGSRPPCEGGQPPHAAGGDCGWSARVSGRGWTLYKVMTAISSSVYPRKAT
jgi:hypothetical protein